MQRAGGEGPHAVDQLPVRGDAGAAPDAAVADRRRPGAAGPGGGKAGGRGGRGQSSWRWEAGPGEALGPLLGVGSVVTSVGSRPPSRGGLLVGTAALMHRGARRGPWGALGRGRGRGWGGGRTVSEGCADGGLSVRVGPALCSPEEGAFRASSQPVRLSGC